MSILSMDTPITVFKTDRYFWAPVAWQNALINPEDYTVTENMIDYIRRINRGEFPTIAIDEFRVNLTLKDRTFYSDGMSCCLFLSGGYVKSTLYKLKDFELTIREYGKIITLPAFYYTFK